MQCKVGHGTDVIRRADCAVTPQRERQLAELVERVAAKKTPVSSYSRMWIMGSAQAKVAMIHLASWIHRLFSDADQKERMRNEARLKAALELLATMGYLRGAVMKLGQMLANLPEVVPEEVAELLGKLHFQAPPMHFSMVREVFLNEFGREPEEIFASFDRKAFAAASLGQVHRARLHTGEEVAVKIQYPDMARTIQADMRNLRLLLQPMRMSGDWHNVLDKLADVEQMLLMETDYEQEAAFGREIRKHFSPEEGIVVPRVFDEYSTRRVLTTEYVHGLHLDRFLALNPDQDLRDHFTELYTKATMRLLYGVHWLMADPNPGNIIFMEDGRLGLIDFGCTRRITEDEWALQREVEAAVLNRDEAEMTRLIVKASLYESAEEMGKERLEVVGRVIRWQLEPWLTEGLFDFGDREFFLRGIESLTQAARKRYARGMPIHIWTTRFILGARAIVYRMKGRCDFRKIYDLESGKGERAISVEEVFHD
jgi:aarF domain-containing kinase